MDLGIIGGADGPTVIFVSGNPAGLILALLLVLAVTAAGLWLFRRRRKK
ncbi:MAG: sodium ion-translocating decarboxylase subunit beta [Oscillibacter sp.]|nr:sodium ion-translocating decarboxylase subunit beta [Oscillibacter sp.]